MPPPINIVPRDESGTGGTSRNLAASPQPKLHGQSDRTPQGSPQQSSLGSSPPDTAAAQVPPRFCNRHKTSDCRAKVDERSAECQGCRVTVQTTYANFSFCAPCSEREESCMICGETAPQRGDYVPPAFRAPLKVRRAEMRGLTV